MKALVVDDDATCRLVLEGLLSESSDVDVCADGPEAVEAARAALLAGRPYDLICIDILMPTMNGLEALQLIRREEEACERPWASKVIVITGSEDTSDIQKAFGRLCDAYLVKPIEARRFYDLLECLC
jgi:two-component system, chemotaxis family, chemotaxis protein CheY